MPPKKVPFLPKPSVAAFVSGQPEKPSPKMKRLTLDIPEELHRAIKMQAAQQGVTIADMLRQVLQQLYGKT